jgi:UDP-N-acetylglucosamine 2-epimerase (non-hydrolysing)
MNRAHIVLTDSGGVQEEAPSLGKPVLVMRDTTERPEAMEAGTVKLVGAEFGPIVDSVRQLLNEPIAYEAMAGAVNPYGDGRAAERTLGAIAHWFGDGPPVAEFQAESDARAQERKAGGANGTESTSLLGSRR